LRAPCTRSKRRPLVESGEVVEAANAGLDDLVRATITALLREVERAAR
jgi:hypothetical protein